MKKDPSNYTAGEQKYTARQQALRTGKPNAYAYFVNVAVTDAGDFVIGLSYNRELGLYSCSAIEVEGVRANHVHRWDRFGGALDGDISDLNVASVHDSVRVI